MGSNEFKIIFEVFGSALSLAFLSAIGYFFVRDQNAITDCRLHFLKLSDTLEALSKHLHHTRDVQKDLPTLKAVKEAVRVLSIHEKNLWFSLPFLRSQIKETLTLFEKLNPRDKTNLSNDTTGISNQLLCLWGIKSVLPYKSTAIPDIQSFLDKRFHERFFAWSLANLKTVFRQKT